VDLDTIICGDCLDVMRDMPDGCVDLVVTSPPYNCRKNYGVFSDEKPWDEWYQHISRVLSECHRILRHGGVIALVLPSVIRWSPEHAHHDTWWDFDPAYTFRRNGQLQTGRGRIEPIGFWAFGQMASTGYKMREPIMWIKGSEGNAICSGYAVGCDSDPRIRPAHEFILLGSKTRWYHDGGTGRRGGAYVAEMDDTKDVWFCNPTNDRNHPAPFPEDIPDRLTRLFVHRANTQALPSPVIFDPYMGTGTVAVVALKYGHHFYGCDISPEYVKLANERIEKTRLELSQMELEL